MNRLLLLLTFAIFFSGGLWSQGDKYWVFFTDKEGVCFDPYSFFDDLAIERRLNHGLSLYDTTDFPVSPRYLEGVSVFADSLSHHSRWFNAVALYAGPEAIEQIRQLDYVLKAKPFPRPAHWPAIASAHSYDTELDSSDLQLLKQQTASLGMPLLQEKGLNGSGIRIAVFDTGFPGVDELPTFSHIRENNRIVHTYDFVRNDENAYRGMSHGTQVLSNIGGILDGQPMGLAPQAEFMLARTEILLEPYWEEENWLAAVEWADQHGAHIINSSLGYVYHRYFPEQMDGTNSLVAMAGNMAAAKGILVVNAAGNSANDEQWVVIGTPADADSVMAVGGINPNTGYKIHFSSPGPTADMRMKPNVSALGQTVVAKRRSPGTSMGTSFASPLVAGFAACALQNNPKMTAMKLFKTIEQAGHLYPYFDYAHGYGMPQAEKLLYPNKKIKPTFKITQDKYTINVVINEKAFQNKDENNGNIIYYNIQKPCGVIHKYYVYSVEEIKPLTINKALIPEGYVVNIHYAGYSKKIENG